MQSLYLMENTKYYDALNKTDFDNTHSLITRFDQMVELNLNNPTIPANLFTIALKILITENQTIQQLTLSSVTEECELTEESCHYLRQILEKHPALVRLSILNIHLGDIGASILAEGLKANTQLQVLILNKTDIMEQGGLALANALHNRHASRLIVLNLNDNQEIGNQVCLEIMKACKNMPHLNTLHLSNTGITQSCVDKFLTLLAANHRLHHFSMESIFLRGIPDARKKTQAITTFHAYTHQCVRLELPHIYWLLTQIDDSLKDIAIPIMHCLMPLRYNHPRTYPMPQPVAKRRSCDEGIHLDYKNTIDANYVYAQVRLWEYCYILHLFEKTIHILYASDTLHQGIWFKPQQGIAINCYNRDYARKMQQLFFKDCPEVRIGNRKNGKNCLLLKRMGLFASLHTAITPPCVLQDNYSVTEVKRLVNQSGYEVIGQQANGDMHSIIIYDKGLVINGINFTDALNKQEQLMYDHWENIKQHFDIRPVEKTRNKCTPWFM